jgi:hypothetical protein
LTNGVFDRSRNGQEDDEGLHGKLISDLARSTQRAMVHSELPISVLFYGQDGAHLLAMTNGPE